MPNQGLAVILWTFLFLTLAQQYHMAAMEEKDIRLKKGLEAIMRMTGEKDLVM